MVDSRVDCPNTNSPKQQPDSPVSIGVVAHVIVSLVLGNCIFHYVYLVKFNMLIFNMLYFFKKIVARHFPYNDFNNMDLFGSNIIQVLFARTFPQGRAPCAPC